MKKIIILVLVAMMGLGALACSQPPAASASVVQSDKPRVTSPAASQSDLAELVDGNTAFSFDLYRVLQGEDGNLLYSPYSISQALAMTYAGARGDTETKMAAALDFTLGQDRLHPAFNSLDLTLASRGQGAAGKDDEGFRLHIVNAIWGQTGFKFLSDYLDLLAENYGAGLRLLDFADQPDPSRVTINDWVAEQTEQRIKDLIPPGSIDAMTRLVLTNAIYFNAAWENPFDEDATSNADFYLLDGGKVSVPMMHQTKSLGYTAGDGYLAVELPYDGHELSMVVIMPDDLASFEASLSGEQAAGIVDSLRYQQVSLAMPKFEYDYRLGLKDALNKLGMGIAFTQDADFSGMDGKKDLYIQDALHKAFISVDEAGTEAAAATAVIVGLTAAPAQPVAVTLDHPFIYFIRDIETGSVLFVGRVVNPG
jgi:serpin B